MSSPKKSVSKRRRRSLLTVGALSTGLILTVTGCGTSSNSTASNTTKTSNTTSTSSSSSSTKVTKGGIITIAESAQTNLNWFIPIVNAEDDSVDNTVFYDQLYKPLLWINNNYTINYKSSIADKITYNKAGTVYHVFLNPKWHWSNGQPVTSKDLMFTWNVVKAASSAKAPSPWPYVGAGTGDIPNGIKSVVPNGKYEVTFTLDKPANQQWFIFNGLIQLTPMPAAVWDIHKNIMKEIKYLGANATNAMFDKVVDGPFMVQSAIPSQAWTLVPNPNYDGHKSTVKKVVFDYEASTAAEFSAVKTGAVNVGYIDFSQLGSKGALTSMGDKITPQYSFGMFYTDLNMFPGSKVKSLMDKLYIRQALHMGQDLQGIDTSIYKGYGPPIDGPIPTTPVTQFLDPALNTNPYPFNIAAGKALLEKHGWKEVHGVMTKDGKPLKLLMIYASGSTSGMDVAELMKEDWAKEGIDVTLKPMPFTTEISVTSNPKDASQWDMATGSGWDYNGPGFYPTGGQLFATGAPSGFGYSSKKEDELIAATHKPYATEAETMKHFFAYEDYTAKQLPFLWANNVASLTVTAPTVHNAIKYSDSAVGFPQIQYWWVSPSASN
ncbi:peptide ABC transporter substrate-binding protein [Alicyclobacillus sp. SP_1]|uniref:peptide ABC transporter substrate-binding protein n=1 Tax=Alicyclobacillus sp. SP_1 TaxID=2942475 RepID=UPI0021575270|nr:peptide ABC transporter substrate-binding protein [Alicyclobacillus sp. SP_1]